VAAVVAVTTLGVVGAVRVDGSHRAMRIDIGRIIKRWRNAI
jgi:hypothetical protein